MDDHVHVIVDGMALTVPAYTTVAAALALAGRTATRRSVGGEPRAALCGMGVCHECRVCVDGRAHVLGCQTLCRDGLVIESGR
ncbi:2Fe-2S iron-sulfur cluster-binding protein [Caballeronia sp. LZ062]|uniref:2Fe-2S iron-sulfur cluster-binding protein n=1 Tax=unclassified Caballeronia TaxID=2646786 RepID=UPI00285FB4CE|nr:MULTISPECIES: 2Fe-2S iron-sulfur cluster-binding protein [unclassified Caballeronia]MDR5857263.1 2Fe-2S iron-sulfur cluster-binding protein [Caballeronia sp. LZ050]MDR5868814.1 2Fe-2S iron-sulfur cluster-binding protein [Caballeronia sp. LZ062]